MSIRTPTLTIVVATALLAMAFLPTAAAHWRTTGAPTAWESPHEHEFFIHSSTAPSIYSGNFQRMCFNQATLTLSFGSQQGCDPAQGGVFPPVRGVTSGGINCNDNDAIGTPTFLKVQPRTTLGLSSVTLDWGATATGPGVSGQYNLADHFAWPKLNAAGDTANPTGATPAHYPKVTATAPGPVQLSITQVGLGALGTGTASTSVPPGIDFGDNDFEFCRGGALQAYAIDSGVAKNVDTGSGIAPFAGAGAGLNDPLGIGGDCVYDVIVCSPVVGTGGSMPASSATPVGVLISPDVLRTPLQPIQYSVCNAMPGAGCTNIPTSGTATRLGNSPTQGDAVYSSSQNCVWLPAQSARTHAVSGREYRGQAARWATPEGNGKTCWPERFVRSDSLVTSIYLPSTQALETAAGAANGAWNPDRLAATNSAIESLSIFVDVAEMRNLHNWQSGCPQGTPVQSAPSCLSPSVDPPTAWFSAPNSLHAFNAVFQP